jgi:large subunit ribosomal protein L31
MKPKIHPQYNKVTVQFPKGDELETYSTYAQSRLVLDVDFRNHPAWTKKGLAAMGAHSAKVSSFNKKFGNISFSASTKKA